MFLDLVDQFFFAEDDPRLWTAEQFIARKTDQIHACRQRLLHSWFVGKSIFCRIKQCARAKIIHNRDIRFVRKPQQSLVAPALR